MNSIRAKSRSVPSICTIPPTARTMNIPAITSWLAWSHRLIGLAISRCTNAHAAMAKEAMMVALAKAPVTPASCQ